jgi:type VI protein secretion system component Hcp
MNKIHVFVFSCLIINIATGQKLEFKKLEFSYFDYSISLKKTNPYLYANIDSIGKVKVKWFNKNSVGIQTSYFTYQLSNLEIKKINTVFKSKIKLSSFFITKKLEKNEVFCGDYDFFLVNYKNSTKDSVCTIEPFMSKQYEQLKSLLDDIFFFKDSKIKKVKEFMIPDGFKKSLDSMYKKSLFLPNKCELPTSSGR